nr:MAG TPA: hypothetical protein [Caudoviricetes sp.]
MIQYQSGTLPFKGFSPTRLSRTPIVYKDQMG